MRVLLASPLGFLIGVSLGAVGGGGSILAVPALVYAAGLEPKQATTASLVIVGVIALVGLPAQLRAHKVRVGAAFAFAVTGIVGSVVGTHVNKGINPDALLLAFSFLMVGAAVAMMRRARTVFHTVELDGEEAAAPDDDSGAVTTRTRIDPATTMKVVGAGIVVGFLTGMFGVGGGFVIVPALVLALGFEMSVAAGTSLLIISLNSAVALAQRYDGNPLAWNAIVAFGIAAIPGVLVGTRLAQTVEPRRLTNWFVALLFGVAAYTAIRSGLALATA